MLKSLLPLALVLIMAACLAHADEGALPNADEIVAKVNARDDGAHVKRKVTMTLTPKSGSSRVRETVSWRKWFDGDKKTLVFFLSPANVRDTGFLTFDYAEPGRDDDQWLYLPAARKVRRISATDRGDMFVGTDFAYEDIKKESKISAEDFTFKTIGIEEVDGHKCYKVDAVANPEAAKELGYARGVSWFDAELWLARKSEYYDDGGRLLRTILTQDVEQIDGIWTALRVTATTHKSGHSTEFRFSDVDYTTPVDDAMFTDQSLMRGARGN